MPVGASSSVAVSSVDTARATSTKPVRNEGMVNGRTTRTSVAGPPSPSEREASPSSGGDAASPARNDTIARGRKRMT